MGWIESSMNRVSAAVEQVMERLGRNPNGTEPVYPTQAAEAFEPKGADAPSYVSELRQPEFGTESDSARAFVLPADDGKFYPGLAVGNVPLSEVGKISTWDGNGGVPELSGLGFPELTQETARARADEMLHAHCEYITENMRPPDIDDIQDVWESRWNQISFDSELKEHLGKSAEGYHYALETSWKGGDAGPLSWSKPYLALAEARTGMAEAVDEYARRGGESEIAWESRQIAEHPAGVLAFEQDAVNKMQLELKAGTDPSAVVETWAQWKPERGDSEYFGRLLHGSMTPAQQAHWGESMPSEWKQRNVAQPTFDGPALAASKETPRLGH